MLKTTNNYIQFWNCGLSLVLLVIAPLACFRCHSCATTQESLKMWEIAVSVHGNDKLESIRSSRRMIGLQDCRGYTIYRVH